MSGDPCCKCEREAPVLTFCPLCLRDTSATAVLCANDCEHTEEHIFCAACLGSHVRNHHEWFPVAAAKLAEATILQVAAEDAADQRGAA